MDPEEICRVATLSPEQQSAEIESLKKEVKSYLFLMVMIAINSAWFSYVTNMIVFYDKNDLGLTGAENAKIQSLLFIPWSFKPIWGCLSDSFYLFGYR